MRFLPRNPVTKTKLAAKNDPGGDRTQDRWIGSTAADHCTTEALRTNTFAVTSGQDLFGKRRETETWLRTSAVATPSTQRENAQAGTARIEAREQTDRAIGEQHARQNADAHRATSQRAHARVAVARKFWRRAATTAPRSAESAAFQDQLSAGCVL